MAKQTSQGTCTYCGKTFGKGGVSRHLTACEERAKASTAFAQKKNTKSGTLLHLQIEGEYLPMYWLHVEVPAKAALADLDVFLRGIWLECCGHLSMFRIGEQIYSVDPWDDDLDMSAALDSALQEGVVAHHDYDFGSTTELIIKLVGRREGHFKDNQPTIMARNIAPEILCDECGKPATQLCPFCLWQDSGRLCNKHAKKHDCGEETLLPVVNSPRVGVCGYTG